MRRAIEAPSSKWTAAKLTAAVTALLLPSLAFAAEGAGSWNPFTDGDVGNFFWTLVTLLVVFFVLNKFAWKPLLGALQEREEFIEGKLSQAAVQNEAAEKRLAEYEERLAGARTEVEAILDEARRDAAALREREESAAKEEAQAMIERAKREISVATDTAVKRLYEQATVLATSAASRILDRELEPEDHERLVAEAIRALETGDGEPHRSKSPAAH